MTMPNEQFQMVFDEEDGSDGIKCVICGSVLMRVKKATHAEWGEGWGNFMDQHKKTCRFNE